MGSDVLEFFKVRGQGGDESIQLGFVVAAQVADLHTEHARKLNPQVGVAFLIHACADTQRNKSFADVVLAARTEATVLCLAVGAVWVDCGVVDFPESAAVELGRGFGLSDLGLGEAFQQGVHACPFSVRRGRTWRSSRPR